MPRLKSRLIAIALVAVLTLFSQPARALPASLACLLIGMADLQALPDGSLVDRAAAAEAPRYLQLTRDARARIAATFGPAEAQPILVFFNGPAGLGPFSLNPYGSTQFIGSRACVMVGPQGQNVDVLAHELMHAEIHHRIGALRRFLQMPTWFDEGLAMQVDDRPRYALALEARGKIDRVRELTTYSSFFVADDTVQTGHYAMAKALLADWLMKVGAASVYGRLQRIQEGESFAEVLAE